MRVVIPVVVILFTTFVVLGAVAFLIMEGLDKIESIKQRAPWLARFIEKRQSFNVLLVLCIIMLIGNGYELLVKESPDVPAPPIVTIKAPPPPPVLADSERQKRIRIRLELGKLLARNNEIRDTCLSDTPPTRFVCWDQWIHWRDQTRTYLSKNMDPTYLARFKATTGIHAEYRTPGGRVLEEKDGNAVNLLTFSASTLDEFIREFQDEGR
jgi:hypothetical protein